MLADMARRQNEADYVLNNLQRARERVLAHPDWFAPAALERIEHATAAVWEVRTMIRGHSIPHDP
jgi:hypothetical protein